MSMNILDDLNQIKKLDQSNVLGSIDVLPKQCEQAWEETKKIKIPPNYKNIDNIAAFGMGGSGLGLHVAQTLFRNKLPFPFTVINDYLVPKFVNQKTFGYHDYNIQKWEILSSIDEKNWRHFKKKWKKD